ncbi:maleylpyruvate isomerase family mycothiol-dependent enzyme [Ornithinimicrobium murale]|uniref:maleylpyruvate isomerase family mycothiol-dependent enzyme n=1 Tax=Ornithinimicrobium murale TaxID=1050153 RepID=UPI000E0DA020|nr:maleylpyruvate isomerase family mycothiol-dependent enzyme [Ornithinimicrobium murale]
MSPTRTAENLSLLDTETDRLLESARGLSPRDLTSSTLCTGWDTAALLTHLARNADALLNLVNWAIDGQERPAYPSEEARRAEIEQGSARPLEEIIGDLEATAHRFRVAAGALDGAPGETLVRTRTGNEVTASQVIAMRALEVAFHHVDLQVGYSFEDADAGLVRRSLLRAAKSWSRQSPPALTLEPEGLDPIELGGGGPPVSGTPGALLLWLARGDASGLRADVELPDPPEWG